MAFPTRNKPSSSQPPTKPAPPKSPFLAPRRPSNPNLNGIHKNESKSAESSNSDYPDVVDIEPEHKSTLMGCTANLITAIVGAGIIGIPYAMREIGLCAGCFAVFLSGFLSCKSLRLLVETAKHVDAPSYETLCEAAFGKWGWKLCNLNMILMSWGPMLSYMMIVKDTLGRVLGYGADDVAAARMVLAISSFLVMLPLSCQRDMADLAKTSRISVLFDILLVAIVAKYSPTSDSIVEAGGIRPILSNSTFHPRSCFIGMGILSFAFSCQHSSLIIAGSLKNPTRERWNKATFYALFACSSLATAMGIFGYIGFLEKTEGDVLNNFPMMDETTNGSDLITAKAVNIARGLLCCTMFFVYPLESFVARHVIMTNLFQGREAHEGDDHAVLDRWDRRVATTIALYISVLIPALTSDDVGLVLAWTGTVAATNLAYIGPGVLFLGVHGEEFLEMTESMWGYSSLPGLSDEKSPGPIGRLLWCLLLMPLWCWIASAGKEGIAFHYIKKEQMTPACTNRLGKIIHKRNTTKPDPKDVNGKFNYENDESETEQGRLINKFKEGSKSVELGLIDTRQKNRQQYGATASSNIHDGCELGSDEGVEESGEKDPQDEKQSITDFAMAIAFIFFGIVALTAGILSICTNGG